MINSLQDTERLTKERDKERKHVARLMRDLEWNKKRAADAEAALSASQARAEALQAEVDRLTAERDEARNDRDRFIEGAVLWETKHKAAEARIATIEKENEGLREALRPFAKVGQMLQFFGAQPDDIIELSDEMLLPALLKAAKASRASLPTEEPQS